VLLALTPNHQIWWHLARASGLVAWALVSVSVLWGLIVSGRLTRRVPPPAWNLDLHRFLGGLAVTFTALHIVGLMADSYVQFSWVDVLVPFATSWKPGAVAWGIVAFYLLLAVELTSLAMRRLPRRLWRNVHATSFLLFVATTIHGLRAGTDAGQPAVRWGLAALMLLLVVVSPLRLVLPARRKRRRAEQAAARPTRHPSPS
jgi:DMSO/TMAO reductase YedYZ heme-binding membrane subunit